MFFDRTVRGHMKCQGKASTVCCPQNEELKRESVRECKSVE